MSKYGIGNYGHYRGVSLDEQVKRAADAAHDRYVNLASNLVEIIGKKAFDAWVDKTWPEAGVPWPEACKLVEQEIESYECSCTPNRDIPCAGCQNYFDMKGNRDE